ncbi:MAG: hypothetical protein CML39_00305 [Rhodobacteraceae bacterium]|nr:MAG: hypothetical protein CML39_00305 [Paracoccaceae bacterium]
MLLICKSSNLAKLIMGCVVVFLGAFQVNGHEQNFKSLVIYHPYLIKENKKEALGFLSVENTSSKSEYLIKIISQFSSGYRLWRRVDDDEFVEINLSSGIEIRSGEAIYIDQDEFKLLFWGVDESLDWYDKHVATFVFRDAGAIELDFEVEQ